MDSIYDELNKSWKKTCQIVLGEEIGELKDFDKWLSELKPPLETRKSKVSGEDITFARTDYCEKANYISLAEITEKSIDPLTINEIKDIDSIVEAVSEKWEYTGSKALGNSKFIENSDNVLDSQYVLESTDIRESSHVYSSSFVNEGSKHIFGSYYIAKSGFLIKCGGYNFTRSLEASWVDNGSDLYYSFYCLGCSDILFCFNQRNKRNCIGNLQLSKEKYSNLKKKLLGELVGALKKDKTFPSLFAMVPNDKPKEMISIDLSGKKKDSDMNPINKAFSTTYKILFQEDPTDISDYDQWLSKHLVKAIPVTSPFGTSTYKTDVLAEVDIVPDKRIISELEVDEVGKLTLTEDEIQSMDQIKTSLDRIGFFVGDVCVQSNNTVDCAIVYHANNMYDVGDGSFTEYCAIDGVILRSKYLFGCNRLVDSKFSINCYKSFTLNRCLELDNCMNCSDSMFSHNCEGLSEAMFCWNTKGKRYVIGNTSLSPDSYRTIKKSIVEQLASDLKENKDLKWNIFNIGCGKQ